jgi:hypothetical protein
MQKEVESGGAATPNMRVSGHSIKSINKEHREKHNKAAIEGGDNSWHWTLNRQKDGDRV